MSNQDSPSAAENTATVEWRRRAPGAVPSPLVRRVPYLECKLEHPGLEPAGLGEQFFPDAVPYDLDGNDRVFYWRPALSGNEDPATSWQAACATTDELRGLESVPATPGTLVSEHDDGVSVVVDGTIGGDTTTVIVESYSEPDLAINDVSQKTIEARIDGEYVQIERGERRRIALAERAITPVGRDTDSTRVVPDLVLRYPGFRELHHPAPGTETRLFPSFGLDLDAVPRTVDVPTVAGELDHGTLAERLGVHLAERPYPERVLWQAFAYAAFDPHDDSTAELALRGTGHIVLTNPRISE